MKKSVILLTGLLLLITSCATPKTCYNKYIDTHEISEVLELCNYDLCGTTYDGDKVLAHNDETRICIAELEPWLMEYHLNQTQND